MLGEDLHKTCVFLSVFVSTVHLMISVCTASMVFLHLLCDPWGDFPPLVICIPCSQLTLVVDLPLGPTHVLGTSD